MESKGGQCGYVALVGRPNVGKSTLLNRLLGQKLSITASKPQTTRHQVLGIKTREDAQLIYVDTPGLHSGGKRAIHRYMNRAASGALGSVDVVIFVVDAQQWTEGDERVLRDLRGCQVPVIVALNKVDRMPDKRQLLPQLQRLAERGDFAEAFPVSAKTGNNVEALETGVLRHLPQRDFLYPSDQVTDRSKQFLAAERVREKLTRLLGQELPYALTVDTDGLEERQGMFYISCIIWVERAGQKAIVIGEHGARLKQVGQQARLELERLFAARVFLRLWVKVREGWADDEQALQSFGYGGG